MNDRLNDPEKDWTFAKGFKWRKFPTGEVVIRLLPQTSPTNADSDNVIRRLVITPAQIDDLSLEVTILQADSYMPLCTLNIVLKRPSRGTNLAGLLLEAEAATWQATGTTGANGHMTLTGPFEHQVNKLTFRVP